MKMSKPAGRKKTAAKVQAAQLAARCNQLTDAQRGSFATRPRGYITVSLKYCAARRYDLGLIPLPEVWTPRLISAPQCLSSVRHALL